MLLLHEFPEICIQRFRCRYNRIDEVYVITIYTRRMELRDLYEDNGMLSDIESLVKQLKLIDELGLIFNPLDHNKKGD